MPINPFIVICAHNEEAWIGKTMELIHEIPLHLPVIVVDDGSTDRTAAIARAKGAKVVTLPKNRGKANAFFAGLREAIKGNATSVLTLDADMVRLDRRVMLQMIQQAEQATAKRQKHMTIAATSEMIDMGHEKIPLAQGTYFSGIRSFSLAGVHFILGNRSKRLVRGYALEEFLNHAFEPHQRHEIFNTLFHQREPIQTPIARAHEGNDIMRFQDRVTRRPKRARVAVVRRRKPR